VKFNRTSLVAGRHLLFWRRFGSPGVTGGCMGPFTPKRRTWVSAWSRVTWRTPIPIRWLAPRSF